MLLKQLLLSLQLLHNQSPSDLQCLKLLNGLHYHNLILLVISFQCNQIQSISYPSFSECTSITSFNPVTLNKRYKRSFARINVIVVFAVSACFNALTNVPRPVLSIYVTSFKSTITSLLGSLTRSFKSSFNRSEEHTSELQSRFDLVCRLLLEKKNKYRYYIVTLLSSSCVFLFLFSLCFYCSASL